MLKNILKFQGKKSSKFTCIKDIVVHSILYFAKESEKYVGAIPWKDGPSSSSSESEGSIDPLKPIDLVTALNLVSPAKVPIPIYFDDI